MAKNLHSVLLFKAFDNLLLNKPSVRLISYNQRRDISNTKPNVKPEEEMKRLNWFYNHHLIDRSASKPMVKIHPSNLLFIQKSQDARHLIVSASRCSNVWISLEQFAKFALNGRSDYQITD